MFFIFCETRLFLKILKNWFSLLTLLLLNFIYRLRNWYIRSSLFWTTTWLKFNMQTSLFCFKMLGPKWWWTRPSNQFSIRTTSNTCCILSINNIVFLSITKYLKKFRNFNTKTFLLICETFFYFRRINFRLLIRYLRSDIRWFSYL